MEKTKTDYPLLLDRIKALFADSVILIILMIVITDIFSLFEHVPDIARAIAFIFIFLLYDPIFTSIFGGTLGHRIIGIRVKKEANQNKNISFPLALVRFILKALLGWISLLTISSNVKKKAIHDMLVSSVVIYKKRNT